MAYVDEAGDEGFKFLPGENGSSRWFVMSAAIFRYSNRAVPVEVLRRSREILKKPPDKPLHFRDLKHEQRLAFVSEISSGPMRIVSVLVYKPRIQEPERYQSGRFLLYKYVVRLLLERISWMCRDARKPGEGDGLVDLIFSDRAAMSYKSLQEYLDLLLLQSGSSDRIRIEWSTISSANVRAVQHAKLAGLQVADAVASSMFYAVQVSRYGYVEPRYASILRRQFYVHRGARLGYGMKFWPGYDGLLAEMPYLADLKKD